jgi:hypothetical protein
VTPLFSIFMLLWFNVMLRYWDRQEATLREKWNLYGRSSESIRIPEFKDPSRSQLRWNSALEQYEHYYPEWKRVLKYVDPEWTCNAMIDVLPTVYWTPFYIVYISEYFINEVYYSLRTHQVLRHDPRGARFRHCGVRYWSSRLHAGNVSPVLYPFE